MTKNILIFSDGTGQAGGLKPDQRLSNIYKLYRATRVGPDNNIDPRKQVAFYDPGLGTSDDAGSLPIAGLQFVRKLISSALGTGLSRNITDCYEAILKVYEPGDRIYLFGFSRGAYTVRSLAGVLNLCGVPTTGVNQGMLPRNGRAARAIAAEAVKKVYEHGAGRERLQFEPEREELGRRFRAKYSSEANGKANVVPYFIGAFDTVASLGATGLKKWFLRLMLLSVIFAFALAISKIVSWQFGYSVGKTFWIFSAVMMVLALIYTFFSSLKIIRNFPEKGNFSFHLSKWEASFYDKFLDTKVRFGRHALAIDETRLDFARVPWGGRDATSPREEGEPEWFKQIWFAGNHSDIGGSYPEEESRLSDITLQWMLQEVKSTPHPIEIDMTKLMLFPYADGAQHCEVKAFRNLYPTWIPKWFHFTWPEKTRIEAKGATIHESVKLRFDYEYVLHHDVATPYRPTSLKQDRNYLAFYQTDELETKVA